MNIVLFAAADFPEGPATTSRIKLISRILEKAGHEVSLALFHANSKRPIAENVSLTGTYGTIDYTCLSGKTVRPGTLPGALLDSLKGVVNSVRFLSRKKRAGKVDAVIFYTPSYFDIFPCLLLVKMMGIPVVLEQCELYSSLRERGVKALLNRLIFSLGDSIMPYLCDGIIVISNQIGRYFKNRGFEKNLFHLPILVDSERFITPSRSEAPELANKRYFVNSGILGQKEGVEYVLRAFAMLSRKHKHLYLVYTGNHEDDRKSRALDLARTLRIDHRILFTGFLSPDELAWTYQHSLGLLCCRTNSPYSNFGFPTKLAEYLCSGKPVIATDVGDIRAYLSHGETALIAVPQESRSIMTQMERLVTDPELARRIGAAGRKAAMEHFDYTRHVVSLGRYMTSFNRKECQSSSATATKGACADRAESGDSIAGKIAGTGN